MSFISGSIKAFKDRESAKEATQANYAQFKQQQAQALKFFDVSRGSEGSAVLPTYQKEAEKRLSDQALAAYNAVNALTPEQQLAQYQSDIDPLLQSQKQTTGFVDSIYSDALLRQRQQEAEPVFAARASVARAQKQGILDDVTARLNAMEAASASNGRVGSGTGFQNALFRSTVPLYQQAATVGAQANLQNAQDLYGIGESNRQLKLQSLGLPAQLAQQSIGLRQLPQQAVIANQLTAQKPFGMFNIGTAAFQPAMPPQIPAVPSGLGIVAGGLGAAGQQLGQYYANQQYAKALKDASTNYNQPAYNPYAAGAVNYDAASIYGNYGTAAGTAAGTDASIYALDQYLA